MTDKLVLGRLATQVLGARRWLPSRAQVARRAPLFLACAALVAGCGAPNATGVRHVVAHTYVFGAFGGRTVDVRDVCARGEARSVRVTRNVSDYAISVATLGMVLRHRVLVTCKETNAP